MIKFDTRVAVAALVAALMTVGCSQADIQQQSDQAPRTHPTAEIAGVASVTDGDTIEIHGARVRLSGFDSPESGSMCRDVNVYQRASLALSNFIGSQTVRCAPDGTQSHGRIVATCRVNDTDLGEHMVHEGWARDWPRFSHGAYANEEAGARAAHRGIWGLRRPVDLWGNRNYSRQ